jgi:hypothetical protein
MESSLALAENVYVILPTAMGEKVKVVFAAIKNVHGSTKTHPIYNEIK